MAGWNDLLKNPETWDRYIPTAPFDILYHVFREKYSWFQKDKKTMASLRTLLNARLATEYLICREAKNKYDSNYYGGDWRGNKNITEWSDQIWTLDIKLLDDPETSSSVLESIFGRIGVYKAKELLQHPQINLNLMNTIADWLNSNSSFLSRDEKNECWDILYHNPKYIANLARKNKLPSTLPVDWVWELLGITPSETHSEH